MDKFRYFEGDYRRKPSQNLAGASKQQKVSELIDKVQCERKRREANRMEIEKATVIQAVFRGKRSRRNMKLQLKIDLSNKIFQFSRKNKRSMNLTLDDIRLLLCYMRFIYPTPFLWSSETRKNKDDYDKIIFTITLLSKYKLMILHAMVEDPDWLWRMINLFYLYMDFLRIKALSKRYSKKVPVMLEVMVGFLDPEVYVKNEPSKDTSNLIQLIWEKLLFYGLLKILIMLVDNKNLLLEDIVYDNTLTRVHDLLKIILRLVISSHNNDFRHLTLKLLAEEVICKDMTLKTNSLVFTCFKKLENFPILELSKVILNLNDDTLFTIHALYNFLSYFDNDVSSMTTEEQKTYTLLLSKLTINIPLVEKTLKSREHTKEQQVTFNELSSMLTDCLNSLNDQKKSERWMNLSLDLIKKRDHEGIFWFCKCLYHLWLSDCSPIYKYRLIRKIAFQPCFLKELWELINNEKRVLNFSSPIYSATVLSMLSNGVIITAVEADKILPSLTMFCLLLKNHVSLLSEELLYEEELQPIGGRENIFSLDEIVAICSVLKEVAVGIISLAFPSITIHGVEQRIDALTPTKHLELNTLAWKTLLEQIVSLLRLLHDRDSRRQFTKDSSFWLSSSLQDLNQSLTHFKKIENITPFSSSPGNVCRSFSVYENRYLTTMRTLPFTIGFLKRFTLYQNYVTEYRTDYQNPTVHFFHIPYLLVKIRRDYLYEDAFDKLCFEPEIRIHLKVHLISSLGVEEPGIDGGGLFREFMTEFMKTAFDPNRGFFILNRDNEFYPNPNVRLICDNFRTHYYFIGKMLGKALFENILVEVPLADFFLSEIMGLYNSNTLYINGLATLDPDLYKNLISLTCYGGDLSELGLDFSLSLNDFGASRVVELKPNGRNIPVTKENVLEYVYLVAQFKVHTLIDEQGTLFFTGLNSIISLECLRMFTSRELQLVISGNKSPIDVDDMKEHAVYSGGYSDEHPTVLMFWNVIKSFNNLQRSLLLRFVTSCSRPPLLGFKELYPPLCIQMVESDDNRLPSSSTCMNILKLPEFTNEEIMKERLLYAIQSGSGFELI